MDLTLNGKHALITGSTRGIGLATAIELTSMGASVVINGRSQETVDQALASAKRAVAIVGEDHPLFRVRLGTGVIALQQAVNDVVERYHWLIMGMVNGAVLLISAFADSGTYCPGAYLTCMFSRCQEESRSSSGSPSQTSISSSRV